MKEPIRSRRGFTLVELLVVVGIIALLISVLLPALSRARDQARMIKCLANMRSSGQAAMVFANTHRDRLQLVAAESHVRRSDPHRNIYEYYNAPGQNEIDDRELLAWPLAIAQAAGYPFQSNWEWGVRANSYVDAKLKLDQVNDGLEMVTCPSDKVRLSTPYYPRNEGQNNGLKGQGDPNNPVDGSSANDLAYWGWLSYGVNEDIVGGDEDIPGCWRAANNAGEWMSCLGGFDYSTGHPCGQIQLGHRMKGRIDLVDRPGDVGLFFETGPESERQYTDMRNFDEFANLIISLRADGPHLGDSQQEYPSRIPNNRHFDGQLNVVFVDGHGETVRPIEFDDNNFYSKDLPSRYAPRVRVSPYPARGIDG